MENFVCNVSSTNLEVAIISCTVKHVLCTEEMFFCVLWLGELRKLHSCCSNYTHYFVLIISLLIILTAHFLLDYRSENLWMFKYSIRLMDEYAKWKGAAVSKIPGTTYRCYSANFKWIVTKHAEETITFIIVWKFCVVERHVWCWEKQKYLLLKGAYPFQTGFSGLK